MKRSLALLPFLTLAACSDGSDVVTSARAPEAPVFSAAGGKSIEGSYMVVLNEGADARSVAAVAGVNPRYVYSAALNGFAGTLNAGQLNALQHNPNVRYIEQDGIATASTTQTGATWGIDRTDQRALPLSTTYSYTNTGVGVTAYIIDTGIDRAHSEFGGRALAGFDAFTDGQNSNDCNGHGTHVAGTVGGTNYGIAKGVTLVAVRVLDCGGSGAWSGVVAGIDWAAANHVAGTPATANMSLGGGASTVVDDAVKRLIADGVATAVAAGNGNLLGMAQNACNYSPARVPEAITIGATTNTDTKASYSNYGSCVDFFAPGSGITSSWIGAGTTETNTISGTSMATPHVAGVAALYLQSNPLSTPQQVRDALFAATTKSVVKSANTTNNHLLFSAY
ncbi:MAG TPA: S8 family serine peptidase [Longimicrobium sp.]|jgi:subtilisin family serine protease